MAKYLFRIDDVCPEIDWEKFERMINLFNKFRVKPLLAVVPDNQHEDLKRNELNPQFWQRVKELINDGFTIGMHGYQHKYVNKSSGLLKIYQESEFATLPYKIQLEKIRRGKEILEKNRIKTDIFIAPWHSFDKNTIKALKETGFKYISDGISLWPFEKHRMIWIPQIAWKLKEFPFGIITFCLHSNSLFKKDFQEIESFIKNQKEKIVDFTWIIEWYRNQGEIKQIFFSLAGNLFKPIWYLQFNSLKIKDINENDNY